MCLVRAISVGGVAGGSDVSVTSKEIGDSANLSDGTPDPTLFARS